MYMYMYKKEKKKKLTNLLILSGFCSAKNAEWENNIQNVGKRANGQIRETCK